MRGVRAEVCDVALERVAGDLHDLAREAYAADAWLGLGLGLGLGSGSGLGLGLRLGLAFTCGRQSARIASLMREASCGSCLVRVRARARVRVRV